ncbi:MAG: hypothetical protein IKS52_09100, partial [Clostridia bacterium]|nr:hypothetical protein [Clostridia bacterium]
MGMTSGEKTEKVVFAREIGPCSAFLRAARAYYVSLGEKNGFQGRHFERGKRWIHFPSTGVDVFGRAAVLLPRRAAAAPEATQESLPMAQAAATDKSKELIVIEQLPIIKEQLQD